MVVSTLANRRFFLKAIQWRVGESSTTYSHVGESSLWRCEWGRSPDPYIQLRIPKGTTNVVQQINTGDKLEGYIEVSDREAIKQLLYTINVEVGGAVSAIEANNTRTIIGYFVIAGKDINLVSATDARTTPTTTASFTNTRIRNIDYITDTPASVVRVNFYADSVTVTTA